MPICILIPGSQNSRKDGVYADYRTTAARRKSSTVRLLLLLPARCGWLDAMSGPVVLDPRVSTRHSRPRLRDRNVEQAVTMDDPARPMGSPAMQLPNLIIIPIKRLPTAHASSIIVIDELNECEEEECQDAFLALVSQLSRIPLVRFGLQGQQCERLGGCLVLDHETAHGR
ncbi:hypothetical protein M413DRAFT_26989 [Hebeloma cylindrosporum]|uniref:Uncharacterized protein n=1 Tax=Hebeloma cylindrosporum TaxID=76867 RepID=A0A0C2YMG6_HEBCY|nr:hypothetical protein M413DRAFT_26989 [Hebeloma cylindrosporum h7]